MIQDADQTNTRMDVEDIYILRYHTTRRSIHRKRDFTSKKNMSSLLEVFTLTNSCLWLHTWSWNVARETPFYNLNTNPLWLTLKSEAFRIPSGSMGIFWTNPLWDVPTRAPLSFFGKKEGELDAAWLQIIVTCWRWIGQQATPFDDESLLYNWWKSSCLLYFTIFEWP